MRYLVLSLWFVGGALGCTLLSGCHTGDRNTTCPTCGGQPHVAAVPVQPMAIAAAPIPPAPVSSYGVYSNGPTAHETFKPVTMTPPPEQTDLQIVSSNVHEKLLERRTFTDLTVNPAYKHAPDYSWLVGELREAGPGVWCVKFASVEEQCDTVTLVDTPSQFEFKPGQLVRVEGKFVDPSSRVPGTNYHVDAIRLAERN